MKTRVLIVLVTLLSAAGIPVFAQVPASECPTGFDCSGFDGGIYRVLDEIQFQNWRPLMREQGQVQWALAKMVKVWRGEPFRVVAVGSPVAMDISCDPDRNRASMCSVTFWGMTGELAHAQSHTFEFERSGRHASFFSPGRTYNLRPAGSQAFVLSRLKTLQD